jgi:hypothetical protein
VISRAGFLFFRLLRLLYYPTATGCVACEIEPVVDIVYVRHEAADFEQAHHDGDVFVAEVVCVIGALGVSQIYIPQISNHSEVILSVAVRDIAVRAYELLDFVEKESSKLGIS